MTERLVVVGGDAGGMSAAATARRRVPEADLEIVAFERGGITSYSACGIPYLVGGIVPRAEDLVARSAEEHRANGIDVRTGHDVVAVDPGAREVRVHDLAGGVEHTVGYDRLVIATGARPIRPDLPGIEADGVFGVQHLEDGIAISAAITAAHDVGDLHHAVVLGAGYIGIEMADALLARGMQVTVIDRSDAPMSTLDPDTGALVSAAMREVGITLRLGADVDGFVTEDGRVRAVDVDGERIPADIVVLGLGVTPSSELARVAGIAVGESGGIAIDDHTRTSAGGVYAAGDCVETLHRVTGRGVAIALGTHANKQGRVAGINATGGDAVFPGVIGTAVAKLCHYEVGRTGLTEREADAAGFAASGVVFDGTTRAGYFPGNEEIRVKLVVETGTGRLLGAQVLGREGAAKRIDVLAVCIWNEMTVEEIMDLDLGYAPPFAPLWDPVVAAARVASADRSPAPPARS